MTESNHGVWRRHRPQMLVVAHSGRWHARGPAKSRTTLGQGERNQVPKLGDLLRVPIFIKRISTTGDSGVLTNPATRLAWQCDFNGFA